MVVEEESGLLKERCTQNVNAVKCEEEFVKANRLRNIRPDKPCHVIRDSLLSSSSGFTNYSGFLNWCTVLLVFSVTRDALENVIKHGILIDPVKIVKVFFNNPTESPSCLILLGLNVFALCSLGIEVLLSKGLLTEKVGLIIIITLLASEIVIPAIVFQLTDGYTVIVFLVSVYVSALFLKLVSYHMTNFWCRETRSSTKKNRGCSISSDKERQKGIGNGNLEANLVHYPDNLNLKDLYFFLCVPTLCYELNFPRSDRIRKTFLVKRVLELLCLVQIISYLTQHNFPTLNSFVHANQEKDYLRIAETLLNFTVSGAFILLSLFHFAYHSYLNAVAEILRFGDRHFYGDWWNAESVSYFWQNWNTLVNKWCVRHLYIPFMHCGFTKSQAWTAVFCFSAFFHEYILYVSLKMFRVWGFLIMLGQIPLSMLLDKNLHNQRANMVVWICFLILSTLCVLLYYHDYYMENYNSIENGV